MRLPSRIPGCPVLRSSQAALLTPRRIPLFHRAFSRLLAIRQQAAQAEDFRDDAFKPVHPFNERRNESFERRGGWRRDRSPQDRSLHKRTSGFDRKPTTFRDETGNMVKLEDDIEKLAEVDTDAIEISKKEAVVKDDQYEGYRPVHWLNYKGKIDDGFLESMKSIFQYAHLTEIQDALVSRMPLSQDFLVRSKTGTGKTLAFLIPAIQRHLDYMKEADLNPRIYPKSHSGILIVTPTRELANQIANEARRLVYPVRPSGLKAQVLVGGDSKRLQITRMDRERNDIIVGTPGRLIDFLETEPAIASMFMHIRTLIFDEVDTLLDMGFRRDIERILSLLEPTEKQRVNLMFSATISSEVKRLAERAMHHNVEFINTVKKDDVDVHQKVEQTYILRDIGDRFKLILSLIIKEQLEKPDGKMIVFFNTTKEVQLYTLLFRYVRRLYANPHYQQFEIHSRKEQSVRTKTNNAFRAANVGSVLFTSDVSARGVDYPGVTKVIQVGAPVSRDIYIHRVGRTGRAGADGSAVLILAPFEKSFLDELTDIPIKDHKLPESELETGPSENKVLEDAKKLPPEGMIEETFMSMLGYYAPKIKQWGITPDRATSELENWTLAMGAPSIPRLSPNFLFRLFGVRDGGSHHRGRGYSSSLGMRNARRRQDNKATAFQDASGYQRDPRFPDSYGTGRSRGRRDDNWGNRGRRNDDWDSRDRRDDDWDRHGSRHGDQDGSGRGPTVRRGRVKTRFSEWPYRAGEKVY